MRLIKRFFIIVLLIAGLLAGAMGFYATRSLTLPTLPFEFSINQGSSLKGAARQMQQAGVFSNARMFVLLGRVLGKTSQIKAGNYELENAPTPLKLLEMMTSGSVSQNELTIIDGWTFSQLRDYLNTDTAILHDSAALSETDILQRLGASETHAEGLFFPDTYYFANGTSDLSLLKRAYRNMQKHLLENWQTRVAGLPIESPYQALILASLVEKETGQAKDRGLIAGVFINRLHKGMLLQTDPTVIYGMGTKYAGKLHKYDLQLDTPYNTYTRAGLTPTPIALPGLAALQAALHPAQTDALYFVARGDGSSEFSGTLAQHNRAVNRYQK
ncbi:MAG: endolytic transglycosylase MltG [Nitrosomonadales bacterium]